MAIKELTMTKFVHFCCLLLNYADTQYKHCMTAYLVSCFIVNAKMCSLCLLLNTEQWHRP